MGDFFYNVDDVRDAARNSWPSVLGIFGVGGESLSGGHSPCPGCGGKDRFRFDNKDGDGTWLCSQGGGGVIAGDGIALVQHLKGIEWKAAVNLIGVEVCPEKARPCGSGIPTDQPAAKVSDGVAAEPAAEVRPKSLKFDVEALRRFCRPDVTATDKWFAARSKVNPAGLSPIEFLDRVYLPDERILIFTDYRSQGQFIHWCGRGSYRLAQQPGVTAKRSELPRGGKEGIWFLCAPVDGVWHPNPRAKLLANGEMKLSRRAMESVTKWSYMVLESDEAPEDLWLNLLAQLPVPIVAIYSSGRRSIHALLKLNVASKVEWDAVKRNLGPLFTKLGADNGALSAVRLTRLPGCWRGDVEQRLIYLNPSADAAGVPICTLPVLDHARK